MELKPHNISVTLCMPQDTDTPGYAIEELTKPAETKAITKIGKLIQPEVVAEKAFEDALVGIRKMKIKLKSVCPCGSLCQTMTCFRQEISSPLLGWKVS